MSHINVNSTQGDHSPELDLIDDDLEGVDDFLNEPNPFTEEQEPRVVADNNDSNMGQREPLRATSAQPLQSNKVPVDYGTNEHELPPGFINYYSRYFEISADAFKRKTLASLMLNRSIFEQGDARDNRELYGSIWICVSVVLMKFLFPGLLNFVYVGVIKGEKVSTFSRYEMRDDAFWGLVHCIWLFGVYTFVVPLIVLQFVKRDIVTEESQTAEVGVGTTTTQGLSVSEYAKELVGMISIYGYGNTIWLITFPILDILATVSRSKVAFILKWVVSALASLKILQFAHYQIYGARRYTGTKMAVSMIFMLGFQVLFTLLLMFMLY